MGGGVGSPGWWRRVARGGWTGAAALALGFVFATAVAALVLDTTPSDLDGFFWPSAEIAAHGHPLLVYAVRSGEYPDANGPLGLLPLSLVALVANALGVAGSLNVRDALAEGVFAVFTLLMAREAVLAVEAGRGRPIRPVATAIVFLVLPPLWVTTIGFGHVEEPLQLWLMLLGVRLLGRGRTVAAGACLGLAVLTRSLAITALIPLVLVLLRERRIRPAAALLGTTALTVVVGVAPFVIADRADLVYSLVTFRSALPIAGGSLWFAIRGAPWAGVVQGDDTWIFLGAAIVLVGVVLVRRRERSLAPPRVHGLLAVAAICVPMLAKTTWPYYFLDPCLLATIWWLGRPCGVLGWRAAAPLALAVGGGVLGALDQGLPLAPLPGRSPASPRRWGPPWSSPCCSPISSGSREPGSRTGGPGARTAGMIGRTGPRSGRELTAPLGSG